MRKLFTTLVVLMLAASAGHAETANAIAACNGTAALTGVPTNPTARGVCHQSFEVLTTTTVSINLEPGTGFIGSLQATVSREGEGHPVAAIFINDTAIAGMPSLQAQLGPGIWELGVTGGAPVPLCGPYPPCGPAVGGAYGDFASSVVPTA